MVHSRLLKLQKVLLGVPHDVRLEAVGRGLGGDERSRTKVPSALATWRLEQSGIRPWHFFFLGVTDIRGLVAGWDELNSQTQSHDSDSQYLPCRPEPTKDPRPKKILHIGRGRGSLLLGTSQKRKAKRQRGEDSPRRSRGISRGIPESGHAGPRIHIQVQRDLDSGLQRPPSSSSYTTSSHPPRRCFKKGWAIGCSRCMQQRISLSTSTRIA